MKKIIFALLFLAQFASAKTLNLYPTEPRCPSAKWKEVWDSNYKRCAMPFIDDVDQKHVPKAVYEEVCRCVSNGLINNPTCAELKKMKDPKFMKATMEDVGKKCQPTEPTP